MKRDIKKKMQAIKDEIRSHCDQRAFVQELAFFDLEASQVTIAGDKHSIMYHWQFLIGDCYFTGRTWSLFNRFMAYLKQVLRDKKLMIMVHNLAYDGKFIASAAGIDLSEVSVEGAEKNPYDAKIWYKANWDNLQFRCSYALTNQSLEDLTEGLEHEKIQGFDYLKKRFPWTELDDKELEYLEHDVRGLQEGIEAYFRMAGIDSITDTIPLTSHSMVRRQFRHAYTEARKGKPISFEIFMNPAELAKCIPTESVKKMGKDIYSFCNEARRGGVVFASRRYIDQLLESIIDPDGNSEYPSVLMLEKFPVGRWKWVKEPTIQILEDLQKKDFGWIGELQFTNIRLKNPDYGFPYAPVKESSKKDLKDKVIFAKRILKAKEWTSVMTSVDFEIIKSQYDWDEIVVTKAVKCPLGPLPKWFTDLIYEMWVIKETSTGEAREKAKLLLNALTGAMAMDFYRYYKEDEWGKFQAKTCWYDFSWYLFMTAYGRRNIMQIIDIDEPHCIYAATDSVKVFKGYDLKKFNQIIRSKCHQRGVKPVIKKNKEKVYPGEWNPDHEFSKFIAVGTSRYAGETKEPIKIDDQKTRRFLTTTCGLTEEEIDKFNIICHVSGPNALLMSFEVFKRGIENFHSDTTFSTVQNQTYANMLDKPITLQDQVGHEFELTSNVVIEEKKFQWPINRDWEVSYYSNPTKDLILKEN